MTIIIPGLHPYAVPASRRLAARTAVHRHPVAPPPAYWTIPALCEAYNWPTGLAGGGIIGIVELGGGYLASDITAAFAAMQLPEPSVTNVSVDGVTNNDPSPGNAANGEVSLDIQIAAASYAVATGQPAQIVVFWAQDIAEAVTAAADYGCATCSISWGADEALWGQANGDAMEAAALAATLAGMIIFAAAGDNDSSDGGPTPANVDLPGSAPHVICCGGTSKPHWTDNPAYDGEVVWNNNPGKTSGEGTGGGYSTLFPAQVWQRGIPVAPRGLGRMVPDVAANADPETGYVIVLDGHEQVFGGTSCVAPLYAGLFAAINPGQGFISPTLYMNQADFVDILSGSNGAYHAGPGPDACSGIGTLMASDLATTFNALMS